MRLPDHAVEGVAGIHTIHHVTSLVHLAVVPGAAALEVVVASVVASMMVHHQALAALSLVHRAFQLLSAAPATLLQQPTRAPCASAIT